jgi:hypothetical protein
MYHVYYSKKIKDKNKEKLLTIYAPYIFCICIVGKKKLIKQNKRKTQVRERERERERERARYYRERARTEEVELERGRVTCGKGERAVAGELVVRL